MSETQDKYVWCKGNIYCKIFHWAALKCINNTHLNLSKNCIKDITAVICNRADMCFILWIKMEM